MNVPLYSLCWYSILYYAVYSLCWYSIPCFSLDLIMCRGLPSLDWRQMMMKWKYTSVSPPEPAYKAHTVNLISLKSQLTSDCNWDFIKCDQPPEPAKYAQLISAREPCLSMWHSQTTVALHVGAAAPSLGPSPGHRAGLKSTGSGLAHSSSRAGSMSF